MLLVLIIALSALNKSNLEGKVSTKFPTELMELKTDYQWSGPKESNKVIYLRTNSLKKLQQMQLSFLECILTKELSGKVLMLMLLSGILTSKELFQQKHIIIKSNTMSLKVWRLMVRLLILFPMEIWFGMGKIFSINRKENLFKENLMDSPIEDTVPGQISITL